MFEHEGDHADLDQGFAGFRIAFVVFAVASAAIRPGKRAFHDPAIRQHHKPLGPRHAMHTFDGEGSRLLNEARQVFAAVVQ